MNVISAIELAASVVLILAGALLFVNAVEWLGRRLDLDHSATGSVLAAIGTALPESLIPAIALLFGDNGEREHVGIGAILGAPLLLSTIAMGIVGLSLFYYSRRNGRQMHLSVESAHIRRDLRFFMLAYGIAFLLAVLPFRSVNGIAALLMVGFYAFYVYRTVQSGEETEEHHINPLKFSPRSGQPGLGVIVAQVAVALGFLIAGAHIFVTAIGVIATTLGVPALILALIVAPLATELPETFNSVIWLGDNKDTLAMGNITGAMVFQSTMPVALGLALSPWELGTTGLVSAVVALGAGAVLWAVFSEKRQVGPVPLFISGILYLGFVGYVFVQ